LDADKRLFVVKFSHFRAEILKSVKISLPTHRMAISPPPEIDAQRHAKHPGRPHQTEQHVKTARHVQRLNDPGETGNQTADHRAGHHGFRRKKLFSANFRTLSPQTVFFLCRNTPLPGQGKSFTGGEKPFLLQWNQFLLGSSLFSVELILPLGNGLGKVPEGLWKLAGGKTARRSPPPVPVRARFAS
jgi:hypothetical protein